MSIKVDKNLDDKSEKSDKKSDMPDSSDGTAFSSKMDKSKFVIKPSDVVEDITNELMLVKTSRDTRTFRQRILKLRKQYAISEEETIPLFDDQIPDHLYKILHENRTQAKKRKTFLDIVKTANKDKNNSNDNNNNNNNNNNEENKENQLLSQKTDIISERQPPMGMSGSSVADGEFSELSLRNQLILERMQYRQIDVSEIVREYSLSLLTQGLNLDWLFKPRRPLRPIRQYFQPTVNPESCRLVIQISHARNLSVRKPIVGDQQHGGLSNSHANLQPFATSNYLEGLVNPFVEISFMGTIVRTFTSVGTHARWEQTLYIPFVPPNGGAFTPSNMQSIEEDIHINLYDQLIVTKQNDFRSENSKLKRSELRWLGYVSIPFTTVYFNNHIEGHLQVKTPLIQLGYRNNYNSPTNLVSNAREPTLLWLFATLDPSLVIPPTKRDNCDWIKTIYEHKDNITKNMTHFINDHDNNKNNNNNNDEINALTEREKEKQIDDLYSFYEYCNDWMNECKKIHPNRENIDILVSDSKNIPHLVCKYVTTLEPPMGIPPEMFLRFVSCVPFEDDIHFIPGARDVWTTIDKFLELGSGDWEEHSLLLASYFKWFESQQLQQLQMSNAQAMTTSNANGTGNNDSGSGTWKTYLCMGDGIPEGQTIYVLRRNAVSKANAVHIHNVILYNAATGVGYSVPESSGVPLCPLTDISIVFNEEQVYYNLQATNIHPSHDTFSYQFEDPSLWKRLFPKNHKRWKPSKFCHPSLQPKQVLYEFAGTNSSKLPMDYYERRQEKLEYIIEECFEKWRKLPTHWNYAVSKTLRDALMNFEGLCQTGGKIPIVPENQNIIAINQIYGKMYGFPLQLNDNNCKEFLIEDKDINPMLSLVFQTKVHENEDPDAEFARAVYIYPYASNISSIWIYIASLSKK